MRKTLVRFATLAAALSMLAPVAARASTSTDQEPGRGNSIMSSWVHAVDVNGDANAIGKFNSNEANRSLVRVNGTAKAVSTTSITISQFSLNSAGDLTVKDYTFTVDSSTAVIRKFKGTASIAEVAVGDRVGIWATSKTNGTAKLIWDKSIWWVALSGKIADLNSTTATFNLVVSRKEPQTGLTMTLVMPVKTSSQTTYFMGTTVKAWSDLANGQTVNVRGSFNFVGKYLWAKKITIVS